ncbi:glycosyltransferase [Phycicoccus sp. Root101]|uniref:glycosyltransferase n=1 Tax=Phycicoccus sp. Root101 TaxID=1736421 RepID=UPI0007030215|nr:glycosyltransferase [Phycicoccus sp. Root101]KQU70452.1 hypothetical protein ASC58_01110 [Phycicoccus sp. Root101]
MSGSAVPSTHPARAVREALDAVRSAPTILEGLRLAADVATASADDHAGSSRQELRRAADDAGDAVVALAAVHALAALPVADGAHLVRMLGSGDPFRVEHAAWALRRAAPVPAAVPSLVDLVSAGGVTGMLAQRTLEVWAAASPGLVLVSLVSALDRAPLEPDPTVPPLDDRARTWLVETVDLVPGEAARSVLLGVVDDESESASTRAAATAALADRFTARPRRGTEPRTHGSAHALRTGSHPSVPSTVTGLTVAQLFLHADIDGELSSAGKGDTGGIATLLVHLGNALLESDSVERVLTISRGRPDGDLVPSDLAAPGHHYVQVPLWGPPVGMGQAWMHRVAVRRGVRQLLLAAGRVDVIHLRMADVGSLAAAEAANELGIPVVFTVAPDPHALLASREASGELTRASFGAADATEHLAFRDHLVRGLARAAAQLVLFPRPELRRDSRALLGLDLDVEAHRATVVPEGIDFRAVEHAGAALKRGATPTRPGPTAGPTGPTGGSIVTTGGDAGGGPTGAALAELDALLVQLPAARRGLPLLVTVGRLNRVKGMATLVETWHADPALRARSNLLVVGGDLDDPSAEEAAELARIEAVVPRAAAVRHGLLLPGHRPHATVAAWLAATRHGRGSLAAPAGVYVSASLKEEFGLAILEAMAASLVVVAPDGGGPATYVEDGVTGFLTDTGSPAALAAAIGRALELAASPEAALQQRRALTTLRDRFSITTMADALACVYTGASGVAELAPDDAHQVPPTGEAS